MSSGKKLITPFRLIQSGNMATNITGAEVRCAHQDSAIAYIEWTGTSPIGVIGFEFLEVDADRSPTEVKIWKPVDFGSTIAVSGNSGSHQLVFSVLPFFALRPVYTATSGIGTLSVTFAAKEG
jgi:hypothetical protein